MNSDSISISCFAETAPQISVATPQMSPNTVKRTGPRLLLIPVQQGSPALRPVSNPQLQGHRMVLQPVRSPSGMNLFRHPSGQIVQLLPLHQIRGSNTQPNLQPVMFRNPGIKLEIFLMSFVFVGGWGLCRLFTFARQVLYHLSYTPASFSSVESVDCMVY
jgi:hypothetical protein